MNTLSSESKSNPQVINSYLLVRLAFLVCALLLVSPIVRGQDMAWPQFRGPDSNPVGANAKLAERWSKTENVEWAAGNSRTRVVVADRDWRIGCT